MRVLTMGCQVTSFLLAHKKFRSTEEAQVLAMACQVMAQLSSFIYNRSSREVQKRTMHINQRRSLGCVCSAKLSNAVKSVPRVTTAVCCVPISSVSVPRSVPLSGVPVSRCVLLSIISIPRRVPLSSSAVLGRIPLSIRAIPFISSAASRHVTGQSQIFSEPLCCPHQNSRTREFRIGNRQC